MQCLSKFPTWPTHPFTPVLMKKRKAINMVRCNQLWLWFVAYRNPLARIFHWEPGSRIVRKKGETLSSSIPQYFTHNHAQWTKNIDTQDKLNLTFCFVLNFAPKTLLFDDFKTIFWANFVRFFWMLLTWTLFLALLRHQSTFGLLILFLSEEANPR